MSIPEEILESAKSVLKACSIPENSVSFVRGESQTGEQLNTYSLKLLSVYVMRADFGTRKLVRFDVKDKIAESISIPLAATVRKIKSLENMTIIDFQ